MPPAPSFNEMKNAIKRMNPSKAHEPHNISLELISHTSSKLKRDLLKFRPQIWETKTAYSDFRDAKVITIFKKGDRKERGNYLCISLLSIKIKIFAQVHLLHLRIIAKEALPELQCGIRSSRGIIDMNFCA